MYVTPNTNIYILKNIPLNKSYENTVYYKNADLQRDAFMKYKKFTLTDYSYQRTQLGTIRVQLKYEDLYDCDYLMFQNTNFSNKWFYAFITGVAYISNEVSEIYYEIDVMQTWCYDYSFLPSFVERRHAKQDKLYENTQPEGLELGPTYKKNRTIKCGFDTYYCLITSKVPSGYNSSEIYVNNNSILYGIYNGLVFACTRKANDYGAMNRYISLLVNQGLEDTAVAFYQAPVGTGDKIKIDFFENITTEIYGFTPKNKKLYNFPFHKFTITNNRGVARDYRPEKWNETDYGAVGETPKHGRGYYVQYTNYPDAQARIMPEGYNDGNSIFDNGIVYGNFATCSFSGSAFSVWWAQNKNNYIASMNAIGNTYDTNVQIAQNNYQMAVRSANASAMMSGNSINTSLANATASNNVALNNAQRSATVGIIGNAASGIGSALSLNLGGVASSIGGMVNTATNYQNQQDSLAVDLANANATAGTALENTAIARSTALRNASTSQASATLSALTAKQNATNQLVAKKEDIANLPPSAKGSASADGLAYLSQAIEGEQGKPGFQIIESCIYDEYAKIVDDYFTIYGYAQNSLYNSDELNERINRPHFTYLKTVGCSITGHLNSNDQIAIQSIYDNGIETWDALENVGHVEINNQPEETQS